MNFPKWLSIAGLLVISGCTGVQLQRDLKIEVDDIERSYNLYIPTAANTKRPLVLLYHGHFGNANLMTGGSGTKAPYKRWLKLAEQDNFLVAIPNGEKGSDNYRGWNDCRADADTNPETDDVKFTLELIKAIHQKYNIDLARVYATGTSNGGYMVIRLAMEVPEYFAGVAAVVASNPAKNECQEKHKPISILYMNGTADPFTPFDGGKVGKESDNRGTALSISASVNYWVKVNATKNNPEVYHYADINQRDKSTVVRYHYAGGKNNTEVMLYEVRNGGHTEPSTREKYRRLYRRIVGNQNYDIEMADEVWHFFKKKSRSNLGSE